MVILPYLPQEILIAIFSFLPAKSVGKFRCLSKPWRNVLSSPDFIKSHLNRKTHQENFILINSILAIHSIVFTKDEIVSKMLEIQGNWTQIVGSCHGLVLLVNARHEKFLLGNARDEKFLVNPITLQQVKLPDSPLIVDITSYGFGYDSSVDDYKIVTLYYGAHGHGYRDFVDVYYVKREVWKRVKIDRHCCPFYTEPHSGVLLNGAIHWLSYSCDPSFACQIAVFDLVDEVFYDMSGPAGLTLQRLVSGFVLLLDGCLCIVDHRSSTQTDVWIMKEYALEESWTKFSINVANDGMWGWGVVKPLCFIGEEEVVLLTGWQSLVVYNLKEGTFRDVNVDGLPEITDGVNFTGSLVSPNFSLTP